MEVELFIGRNRGGVEAPRIFEPPLHCEKRCEELTEERLERTIPRCELQLLLDSGDRVGDGNRAVNQRHGEETQRRATAPEKRIPPPSVANRLLECVRRFAPARGYVVTVSLQEPRPFQRAFVTEQLELRQRLEGEPDGIVTGVAGHRERADVLPLNQGVQLSRAVAEPLRRLDGVVVVLERTGNVAGLEPRIAELDQELRLRRIVLREHGARPLEERDGRRHVAAAKRPATTRLKPPTGARTQDDVEAAEIPPRQERLLEVVAH